GDPLGFRQDPGHRPGPQGCRSRVRARLPAVARTGLRLRLHTGRLGRVGWAEALRWEGPRRSRPAPPGPDRRARNYTTGSAGGPPGGPVPAGGVARPRAASTPATLPPRRGVRNHGRGPHGRLAGWLEAPRAAYDGKGRPALRFAPFHPSTLAARPLRFR